MPLKLHKELIKRANKLGLKGKRRNAYIYGTLWKYKETKKKKK